MDIRRLRHQLEWLATTRPDLLAAVNILSHTTAKTYRAQYLRLINQVQRRAAGNSELGLPFHALDAATLLLIVYSDASFAGNADGTSQLGFIIRLGDVTGRAGIIQFSSLKAKRVVRSVLGAEIFALR